MSDQTIIALKHENGKRLTIEESGDVHRIGRLLGAERAQRDVLRRICSNLGA